MRPKALNRRGHRVNNAPRLLGATARVGIALADLVSRADAETNDTPRRILL